MTDKSGSGRRGSGRPRGADNTREHILATASEAFAATGYDGASLRTIARSAGVDPSTVVHFFGTKEGLFQSVIEAAVPATEPLISALGSGASGTELARIYFGIWEDPEHGPAVQALFRTALSSEQAIGLMRSTILGLIDSGASGPHRLGIGLAMTHLLGAAIGRNIVQVPELVNADLGELCAQIGPVLDGYLAN